ncbi:MAG: hypothetical protein IT289_07215 [Oligoflexia bacterium]|nr:hypothetical protein [Oligoflexia bacterium]
MQKTLVSLILLIGVGISLAGSVGNAMSGVFCVGLQRDGSPTFFLVKSLLPELNNDIVIPDSPEAQIKIGDAPFVKMNFVLLDGETWVFESARTDVIITLRIRPDYSEGVVILSDAVRKTEVSLVCLVE